MTFGDIIYIHPIYIAAVLFIATIGAVVFGPAWLMWTLLAALAVVVFLLWQLSLALRSIRNTPATYCGDNGKP